MFRSCCEVLHSKEIFEGCLFRDIPLAIHVPMNPEEMVPGGAFTAVPRSRQYRSRHQSCGSRGMAVLPAATKVRMPASVVRIADNTFRSCHLLNSVTAPGCVDFGYKAFAECSSLQWVHASEGEANQFCSSTKFGHYLFRDCINLATFVLQETNHQQEPQARMEARELSQGCLSSSGSYTGAYAGLPSAGSACL